MGYNFYILYLRGEKNDKSQAIDREQKSGE